MKTLPSSQSIRLAFAALAGLALGSAPLCQAEPVKKALKVPAKIRATIDNDACDHDKHVVTLSGAIHLSGFKTQLTFKKNRLSKRSASFASTCEATIIPLGGTITVPEKPSEGGAGKNPHVYLQFRDAQGNNLTEEYYLGRCEKGLYLDADVLGEMAAECELQIDGCANRRGPNINIDCDLTLSGMQAAFIFRDNKKGKHTAEVTTNVEILSDGSRIKLPKKHAEGGVGRNPLLILQFLNDKDEPMCEPVNLGRCNKL